jgi:hypothetical protein
LHNGVNPTQPSNISYNPPSSPRMQRSPLTLTNPLTGYTRSCVLVAMSLSQEPGIFGTRWTEERRKGLGLQHLEKRLRRQGIADNPGLPARGVGIKKGSDTVGESPKPAFLC